MHAPQDAWPRAPWARPGSERRYGRHGTGLATLVSLVQVIGAQAAAREVHAELGYPRAALLLVASVALAWRRQAPLPVLAVVLTATLGYAFSGHPYGPFFLAATAAYFAAVAQGRRVPALVLSATAVTAYIACGWWFLGALDVLDSSAVTPRHAVVAGAWLVAVLAAGEFSRGHRAQRAALARMRAEQRRIQEEQERRQASEERLRIARELHDVLGHHLSLINVQAGVGLHLIDQRPEQAREALTVIKSASAEALREVRSVLAALRPAEEAAPRTPAPGLDRLDELTSGAGFPVETTVTGAARPLPAEVDRAAFRIVQEALTNVRRHAGPAASATVSVAYEPGQVTVSVSDDGPPPGPAGEGGNGIAGMRARAIALGGTLTAGPDPGGSGWRVEAVLPDSGQSDR
ncbi:two-component sensor histidine kinase [Asanoa ishikariensis]|uniref:histidine kinase n=1 Tax=Asanoa ishikariensis TaxID=137265 RepID=A0A1H3S6T7_9ACTN|nr:sensor histidine kinase [Asanoa ishikariensis]GIF66420.1 two-component sensor histidine kinase [Asanoa ishikariensis]SDZ33614.1 Signal transduction histidine kinase [Asanoa ishikariensis]